ncbi:MAG: MFS transporter, partial [Pseudomonadota bacterium]
MSETTSGPELQSLEKDRGFFGHPKGLAVLFFAEMWERFSFYGMRALLVLYLTQHFLFSDSEAQGLYAAYASLVYLMPIIGGFIADRYLGARRAVVIGAVFLTFGHCLMAFEGSGSQQFISVDDARFEVVTEGRGENVKPFLKVDESLVPIRFSGEGIALGEQVAGLPDLIAVGSYESIVVQQELYVQILFAALSLIIVGVGFLKANISSIVGTLYEPNDSRRDPGFTIFYMGINLGSVLATFFCGWLGIAYGWNYGFGLAGIGMALGLITFVFGTPLLRGRGEAPLTLKGGAVAATWVGGILSLAPIWFLVQRDEIVSQVLGITAPALLAALIVYAVISFKGSERTRMIV